jgi:hypothetical protein
MDIFYNSIRQQDEATFAELMEAMLDSIADNIAETRAKSRLSTLHKARKAKLDDL